MISSEVQRTLVKSPPELWAELSDPTALARHLGELGEIRIIRVEPECTVEWAAENTTGTVSIKPSGWGTNVKLTATRELTAEPEAADQPQSQAAVEPEPQASAEPEQQPQPQASAEPEPEPQASAEPEPDPQASAEPEQEAGLGARVALAAEPEVFPMEPEAASEPVSVAVGQAGLTAPAEQTLEPKPRLGFFARLFGRGRGRMSRTPAPAATTPPATPAADPTLERAPEPPDSFAPEPPDSFASKPPDPFAAVREALAPESFASSHPFAALPPPAPSQPVAGGQQQAVQASQAEPTSEANEPTAQTPGKAVAQGISAELMAAEDVAAEEVTAVLTAVLDRLGAAHHRPFSRA
jgi:hypothetical protein